MPSHGVLDHLEEHRAVASGADLELVEKLYCFSPPFCFHLGLGKESASGEDEEHNGRCTNARSANCMGS